MFYRPTSLRQVLVHLAGVVVVGAIGVWAHRDVYFHGGKPSPSQVVQQAATSLAPYVHAMVNGGMRLDQAEAGAGPSLGVSVTMVKASAHNRFPSADPYKELAKNWLCGQADVAKLLKNDIPIHVTVHGNDQSLLAEDTIGSLSACFSPG